MVEFVKKIEKTYDVRYLEAVMDVRYWEDATVNGVEETNEDPKIPLRQFNTWKIVIDLETGTILDWPKGVTASVFYKVCDSGMYSLMTEDGEIVFVKRDYVPSMLCPNIDGYGDYVGLDIDENGKIDDFYVNLAYFGSDEEDY